MNKNKKIFNKYKNDIEEILSSGNYTEYTFRSSFEHFIKSIETDLSLIHEPKREKGLGAPDYTLFIRGVKIGYIETKNIGENLDEVINSDQIKRYVESIDNVILTNYKRFILIRNHNVIEDLILIREDLKKINTMLLLKSSINDFIRMMEIYCSYSIPTIKTAEELAYQISKGQNY